MTGSFSTCHLWIVLPKVARSMADRGAASTKKSAMTGQLSPGGDSVKATHVCSSEREGVTKHVQRSPVQEFRTHDWFVSDHPFCSTVRVLFRAFHEALGETSRDVHDLLQR
jgi:hypothetical protein